MAGAVARTLADGELLMVEAGTGVGKTLAYLVPAIADGRRVVVSTGTRNLQDQIHGRDLPLLRERLGFDVRAVVMKGRDNYLCRTRFAQLRREPLLEDAAEAPWIERLAEWSETTESGDRAEVDGLPDRLRLWKDVNARADTCTGQRCPDYEDCWLTRLKREAQRAQLIVVNHHLFFADLALRSAFGQVLPDYDAVVFDEAHLLEEIATLYFGTQVSSFQLDQLAADTDKVAARAAAAVPRAATRTKPKGVSGAAAQLRLAAVELFAPIQLSLPSIAPRAAFTPTARGGLDLEAEWATLDEALEAVKLETAQHGSDPVAEAIPQRCEQLRVALERVLARDDPDFVYGIERRGRGVAISAAPVDVSGVLRRALFDEVGAAVLTSATLTVDGSFDYFAERLGVADRARTLAVESPFAYREQAVLYLPRGMPEPRERDFGERSFDEILALLEITDGHAFLLFTSHAALGAMRERFEDVGRWPLFVQGEAPKAALVERFRETPRAVLLGTASFWHGVDVPGDALSLVVVDKLPFAVPSDPLVSARVDRIRESGGNPFRDYQVPVAVLELKQGIGRLIRSRRDRGIVAILDPRLTTKGYGRRFLDSLPPFRVVREVSECAQFMHPEEPPF